MVRTSRLAARLFALPTRNKWKKVYCIELVQSILCQVEVNSSLPLSFVLVKWCLPMLENIKIMIERFNLQECMLNLTLFQILCLMFDRI
jgi:hypothetical protein